ncbi:MAG: NYN domain-containing protein [Porticoccaceae bacterium]|nr:NYN domain-containing protein [Porticoccaceae bacterium]
MKRIALFIDVQNIYYTVRDTYQGFFSYQALWNQLSKEFTIVSADAYAIESVNSKQRSFQQTLRNIGFDVNLKPFIQRADGSAKGDWDVGIAIDMMDAAARQGVDKLVLLSGDGDFDRLLQRIYGGNGKETLVYGVPQLTAASLIDAASEFRSIDKTLLMTR